MIEEIMKIGKRYDLEEIKKIKTKDIVLAEWVRQKCKYGCIKYGKSWTCPPATPDIDKMRKILKEYKRAFLLRFDVAPGRLSQIKVQKGILAVERKLFLLGFYKALALSSGPCGICQLKNKRCRYPRPCRYPKLARPSMESCSIDVYATTKKAGMKIKVLKNRKERMNCIGMVLLD